MTLLELINNQKHNAYHNYRLKSMRYSSAENLCEIYFNYVDDGRDFKEIEPIALEILNQEVKFDVKYKFNYGKIERSTQGVKNHCISFINDEMGIKLQDGLVNVKFDDINPTNCQVEIDLPALQCDMARDRKINEKLANALNVDFCLDSKVIIQVKDGTNLPSSNELMSMLKNKQNNKMSFSKEALVAFNVEKFIGHLVNEPAIRIKDAIKNQGEVVVTGTVNNVAFTTGVKQETQKEWGRLNFNIDDGTATVPCLVWRTIANAEAIELLKDGDTVILKGMAEDRGGKVSIKSRDVSRCELPVIKKVLASQLKEPIDYVNIRPVPYEEFEQEDLFNSNAVCTDPYVQNNVFVSFDVETTGLNPVSDAITEIGAVRIVNGVIQDTFSALVNPQKPIPQQVVDLTGITDDMVADCPTWQEISEDVRKYFHNAILVGHNIADFDMAFINRLESELGYSFDNKIQDTYTLARKNLRGLKNYKLNTVAEYYGITNPRAHRATADAITSAKVFLKLISKKS